MKRAIAKVILLSLLILVPIGCVNESSVSTNPVEPRISGEKAVALATQWIPQEVVSQAGVRARLIYLPPDAAEEVKQSWLPLEPDRNYWAVIFDVKNLTIEQLGWETSPSVELGAEEVYQTLQIYINAETGGTTFRRAAAGIKLGGPVPEPTIIIGKVDPSVIIAVSVLVILGLIIAGYYMLNRKRIGFLLAAILVIVSVIPSAGCSGDRFAGDPVKWEYVSGDGSWDSGSREWTVYLEPEEARSVKIRLNNTSSDRVVVNVLLTGPSHRMLLSGGGRYPVAANSSIVITLTATLYERYQSREYTIDCGYSSNFVEP